MLFIRCFKLICTVRVIDCKHRHQWLHQQILYSTVPYRRGIYEKKNRSLVFSGSRKIQTLRSTVQWETWQASFPTGTVGPRAGIFLSPLNTNDGFYLSHIHVPAHGKDKKWTATCLLPAGCMSISDIIVMLKWRHHVAFQWIQDFMEAFFMFFFQYEMWYLVVSKKKNP